MTIANESTVIAEAIQTILQNMARFQASSVTIDDWSILDLSEANAPWAIVFSPGLAAGIDSTFGCDTNEWTCPVSIQRPFLDWLETRTALREDRDDILATFTNARNLETTLGRFSVRTIADATPFDPFIEISYTDDGGAVLADNISLPIIFTIVSQE